MESKISSLFLPKYSIENARNIPDKKSRITYALLGVSVLLYISAFNHMGKLISVPSIFLISLITGPILGVASGYIASYLFYKLSDVLGIPDKAVTLSNILSALALSSRLLFVLGILTSIEYLIYGDIVFTKINVMHFMGGISGVYYTIIEIIQLIILFWTLILNIIVLSKVRDISIGQTFGSILVSSLFIGGASKIILILIYII